MTEHVEGRFRGAAGGDIYWQGWTPPSAAKGAVVLAHGLAEHGGRYAHVGARLASAGYALYLPDHRGHGKSSGLMGNIDRMAGVVADLAHVVQIARGKHPGAPVFLAGHSMGGLVALDYVTSRGEAGFSGLVLSGSAVDPTVGSKIERVAAKLLSSVAPNLAVTPLDSKAVSRDPEEVRKYEADPLNYHGRIRVRTGAEILAAVERVGKRFGSVSLPALVMHGAADTLVSPNGSKLVASRISSKDVTLKIYEGLFHEIFNEPERETVLGDVVSWLDRHTSRG